MLPFLLGLSILWWMYRGTDWTDFFQCVTNEMHWSWMLLSLPFGILPQMARAWRWKMSLEPLGEKPRRSTCVDAIFLSYAASLVIPRVGEVTRCGTLKKCDGVSFTKSLGTVVTERLVDSLFMLLFTGIAFVSQLPLFLLFLDKTGTNLEGILSRFTGTGYLVTALCVVTALVAACVLMRRYALFRKGKNMLHEVCEGIMSLRNVSNLPLYLFYSLLIWVGYFLHFYIAFFSFDFTSNIGLWAALLSFCRACAHPQWSRPLALCRENDARDLRCGRTQSHTFCTRGAYHSNRARGVARRIWLDKAQSASESAKAAASQFHPDYP